MKIYSSAIKIPAVGRIRETLEIDSKPAKIRDGVIVGKIILSCYS